MLKIIITIRIVNIIIINNLAYNNIFIVTCSAVREIKNILLRYWISMHCILRNAYWHIAV